MDQKKKIPCPGKVIILGILEILFVFFLFFICFGLFTKLEIDFINRKAFFVFDSSHFFLAGTILTIAVIWFLFTIPTFFGKRWALEAKMKMIFFFWLLLLFPLGLSVMYGFHEFVYTLAYLAIPFLITLIPYFIFKRLLQEPYYNQWEKSYTLWGG